MILLIDNYDSFSYNLYQLIGSIRRELGVRTVFNILGPLTNPARPVYQVLGVYSEALLEPLARALISLGVKRGLVVYGQDRLDEISVSAPTSVYEIDNGVIKSYTITPEQFGMERCDRNELKGGSPEENAEITEAVLKGEKGAKRNAVLLNAGGAIYASGAAESIEEGIKKAAEAIDSGAAYRLLEKYREVSNS